MKPHKILVATVATKMPSGSALHTLKTSGHSSKWRPVEKFMLSSSWKKCKSMTVFTISTAKVIKTSILRLTAGPKIGEKFDISAADAEKKIENVRTGYGRYLKKS